MKRKSSFISQGTLGYDGTRPRKYGPTRADFKPDMTQYVKKSELQRQLNAKTELKFLDTPINTANVDQAGAIVSLSDVPQGVTDVTRVGNNILPKRLKLRYSIVFGDTTQLVRVIVFRWKMNDASDVPAPNEILQNQFISTAGVITSDYNEPTRTQFEVLYDKTHRGSSTIAPNSAFVTTTLKLARKKIEYKSDAVVTGLNKIFIMYISDSGAIPHPTILTIPRLYYVDS